MSQAGQFWKDVREQAQSVSPNPVMLGQVITLNPFVINFQGVEIGASYGDNIYVNNLLLDENIDLGEPPYDVSLNPPPWISLDTSNADYQAQIPFLKSLYDWVKSVHNRFILHIGDYVAVQRLGNKVGGLRRERGVINIFKCFHYSSLVSPHFFVCRICRFPNNKNEILIFCLFFNVS